MKRPRPRRRSFPRKIYTQNCRGLKTDIKLTELIQSAWRQDAFAVCVQETWRCAQDFEEENGWTFIGYGPAQQHGRGSRGVGILLNPVATAAWRRADGGVVYRESDRMIAIRVEAEILSTKSDDLISSYSVNMHALQQTLRQSGLRTTTPLRERSRICNLVMCLSQVWMRMLVSERARSEMVTLTMQLALLDWIMSMNLDGGSEHFSRRMDLPRSRPSTANLTMTLGSTLPPNWAISSITLFARGKTFFASGMQVHAAVS